jgi:shikimate kinase
MMGSGKSTVGKAVAETVGAVFYDTDEMVVDEEERTIAQIWADEGEEGFRRREARAVQSVPEDAIVAGGGGVVLDPANRETMARSGKVVWLRADAATLTERLQGATGRPLLSERGTEITLSELLTVREAIYSEVATHEVDTTSRTFADVVTEVVEIWRS